MMMLRVKDNIKRPTHRLWLRPSPLCINYSTRKNTTMEQVAIVRLEQFSVSTTRDCRRMFAGYHNSLRNLFGGKKNRQKHRVAVCLCAPDSKI
jgi:hypothetical protein